MTSWLIPVATTWSGRVFGDLWPATIFSFIMAEAQQVHQRDIRDVTSSADQDLMRKWANTHGKCVRQRTVKQETTKYKAGTLPLNMYQTAVHRGERIEFSPVEPEFPNEEGTEGAPTSRDPGDVQLSEYDDDFSDNDCDDFAVEGDGAIRDVQNEGLGLPFASRRTRSGRKVTTTRKAFLWT